MYALTVATENRGYLDALRESCGKAHVYLRILGFGKKWLGFTWRYGLLEEELIRIDESGAGDELAIILDGYDTIVCSNAKDIAIAHEKLCREHGWDPKHTIALAPEHHDDWCSSAFNATFHRISKYIFGVPFADPFVLNAGVVVGTVNTLLRYTKCIKLGSDHMADKDDQRILNKLWRENGFQRDNIFIAVDLDGSIAYCHANRMMISCLKSQMFDHNRHKIIHTTDLSVDEGDEGDVMVRRSGASIGVLHAICNADIDEICSQLNIYNLPTKRKPISQPALRFLMVGMKTVMVLVVFFAVLSLKWRSRAYAASVAN